MNYLVYKIMKNLKKVNCNIKEFIIQDKKNIIKREGKVAKNDE